MTDTTQNERGQWVPSIPLPFYGLRKRCHCGRKFWTEKRYRAHYALRHVEPARAALTVFTDVVIDAGLCPPGLAGDLAQLRDRLKGGAA